MDTSLTPNPVHTLKQQWQHRLDLREQAQQKRCLRTPLAIDFVSNDYLGWARSSPPIYSSDNVFFMLAQQFSDAHGATGSRLLSGQSTTISALESAIAQFHQTEAALIFNSGFDANLGILSSISSRRRE